MPNTLSFRLLLFSWAVLIQVAFAQISFPLSTSGKNNCAGSSYCGKELLPSNHDCLGAINFYNTSYNDYNSYTSHYYQEYGNSCTAIYTCDDNEYLTLNGYELQQLFQSIYVGGTTGAPGTTTDVSVGCNICGSLYFNDDKCRVTLNYCAPCHATYPSGG